LKVHKGLATAKRRVEELHFDEHHYEL
jgi:hypothetical protein